MARIPTHTLVSPRFSGVETPPGVWRDTTQSVANLIQAAGGSLEQIVRFGQEAQEIRNKSDVRQRVRDMQSMQAEFLMELERENVDPAEWAPRWQERLSSYESTLKEKGLPPVVVQQVTDHFQDFAGTSLLSISASALKEDRRRARGLVELDYRDAMQRGAFDEARQAISGAGDIFDEVELKAYDLGTTRAEEAWNRDMDREADPLGYAEKVKAGEYGLSPVQKKEELKKAEQTAVQKEKESVEILKTMIDGKMIQSTEELETELEGFPEISPARKKAIIANFKLDTPLSYEERFSVGDKMRDDFRAFQKGEIDLEEYTKRHNENQITIESYGNRSGAGALKSQNYQIDPVHFTKDGDLDKEAARQRAAQMKDVKSDVKELARERATGAASTRMAGRVEKEGLDGEAKAQFAAEQAESAMMFRSEMEDALMAWVESQPEPPSIIEIKAYADKIQPQLIERLMKKTKEAIQKMEMIEMDGPLPDISPARRSLDQWLEGPGVLPPIPE